MTHTHTQPYLICTLSQGVADGAGVPYQDVVNIAMFPELIKAACTMFGAWGNATDVDRWV
jgi:hypothetical protein